MSRSPRPSPGRSSASLDPRTGAYDHRRRKKTRWVSARLAGRRQRPRAAGQGMTTTVSVVVETASVHSYDDITIADCVDAVARQTYPRDLIQLVVVDDGRVKNLSELVTKAFPGATMLPL